MNKSSQPNSLSSDQGKASSEMSSIYNNQEFHIYQEAIKKIETNDDLLPSLPTITLEIRKALSNPNISAAILASLIAKDPGLTAILMKHASSVLYRTVDKPKNIQDVINRLGMRTIENLTLAHSIKSLFVLQDYGLKKLYKDEWQLLTLNACMSFYLAKQIKFPCAEDALVASLLSGVGKLALLVSLQGHTTPTPDSYRQLCKSYSKHLGLVLLAKWGVSPCFAEVLRRLGAWRVETGKGMQLQDIVNLGYYHSFAHLHPDRQLMPLSQLTAYQKLAVNYNALSSDNLLKIVVDNMDEIQELSQSFQ